MCELPSLSQLQKGGAGMSISEHTNKTIEHLREEIAAKDEQIQRLREAMKNIMGLDYADTKIAATQALMIADEALSGKE